MDTTQKIREEAAQQPAKPVRKRPAEGETKSRAQGDDRHVRIVLRLTKSQLARQYRIDIVHEADRQSGLCLKESFQIHALDPLELVLHP